MFKFDKNKAHQVFKEGTLTTGNGWTTAICWKAICWARQKLPVVIVVDSFSALPAVIEQIDRICTCENIPVTAVRKDMRLILGQTPISITHVCKYLELHKTNVIIFDTIDHPRGLITSFTDEWQFLSNFYPGDKSSLEHKYQAGKFQNPDHVKLILDQPTPSLAKKQARILQKKGHQNPDFFNFNLAWMEQLVKAKFQDPFLRAKLEATHPVGLIEGNSWGDDFWGCVWDNGQFRGQNLLGCILMRTRALLIDEQREF